MSEVITQLIRSNKCTPDVAITHYMNARNYRHDIWVDFLNKAKAEQSYIFNDVKISDFITEHDLNIVMDDKCLRLTPDIMAYNRFTNTLIIGDVACTTAVEDTNRRKYLKYKPIADAFRESGLHVIHQNFIVNVDLYGIQGTIRTFELNGVINNVAGLFERTRKFHIVAHSDMLRVIENCTDKSELRRLISLEDAVETKTYEQLVLPNDVEFDDIEHWPIMQTENELATIVKAEVKKIGDEYFDKDLSKSSKAFEDLYQKNREREHTKPKSTLKVVQNCMDVEQRTGFDLLDEYIFDANIIEEEDEVASYIKHLLPSTSQASLMRTISKDKEYDLTKHESKTLGVYGSYQYDIPRNIVTSNVIINNLHDKLKLGKKRKNDKKTPKSIDPDRYVECYDEIEETINYYGMPSSKPPFLDNTWDAATQLELDNTQEMRLGYNNAKATNGAQLCNSMSQLYQRLCHLKTSLSTKDNIFIATNGSFLAIIPKDHAPVTSSNCDLPMVFITRIDNNSKNYNLTLKSNEYEYSYISNNKTYIISKLCRLNIDKMSNWDQSGYRVVANSSYISSKNNNVDMKRVVGLLTMLTIDIHQKTSELLDLLKYVAFMPFADLTRLSSLISDKFDIMIKTKLDAWTIKFIEHLMIELSDKNKLNASKPKLKISNGVALSDSFGMNLNLPSLFDMKVRHPTPDVYIEDVAMIYIVRGKQLYGSQFMDKSITQTAKWQIDYEKEVDKYGNWAVNGYGDTDYPFDSKFAFNSSAILHALEHFHKEVDVDKARVMKDLHDGAYNNYMHYNCSLRGCVKEPEERKKPSDLHTTSMESCLNRYVANKYDDTAATSNEMAYDFLREMKTMEFSMSEKEQRGGGRPIATPTLLTKAALMMIEKPEASIGKQCPNNIIVSGKHKMQEISECYKKFLTNASIKGFKLVYQITEDQTKWSEMDNPRKFLPYIDSNPALDTNVKRVQRTMLKKLLNREHLVKRMPKDLNETELSKTRNLQRNGVKTGIGWPQGMLNYISTSIHMIADLWITKLYNIAYPNGKVETKGLTHSDDSWVVIACNNELDFENFLKFRIIAKRMFCLKINEKKLWASRYLGELVSNYNINGNVYLSVAKTMSNSFGNLSFQNWVIDVHNQISTLQQCYRNGADIPTITLLATILRQQIVRSYQVFDLQKNYLNALPVELGGYPSCSPFELATNGLNSHYYYILENVKNSPGSIPSTIILRCLHMSIRKLTSITEEDFKETVIAETTIRLSPQLVDAKDENNLENDYSEIKLPYRGDVFSCVKHLLPHSKKIRLTINRLRSLPYMNDGLELIITRPKTLEKALGHLKAQTANMLYVLASEHYTQNARRMAINQTMQATGKILKLPGLRPMSINEMLSYFISMTDYPKATLDQLSVSFTDSNPIPLMTNAIVMNSEHEERGTDKRKVINKLPNCEDNFTTLVPLRDILLHIIDKKMGTKHYNENSTKNMPLQLLTQEAKLIETRFTQFYTCYNPLIASNLIMKLYMENRKSKLWMHPHLNNESMSTFLEDLYGKTLNPNINYIIKSNCTFTNKKTIDSDIISSLYTVLILNNMYDDKFNVLSINGKDLKTTIDEIDHTKLPMNDILKIGILRNELFNDNSMLKYYDDNKNYSKYYLKKQQNTDGNYKGSFEVLLKFGSTVVKVTGNYGDITLEVNKIDINDILMALMIYNNEDFPHDKYNIPSLWSRSGLYKSQFRFGHQFLTPYTQTITIINRSPLATSIPIVLNENLRYPNVYKSISVDAYIVEDNLRTVYKTVNGKKIRVGNVKQSMYCPLHKSIVCVEDCIDGISNNDLLRSKVIINITQRRPYANKKDDLIKILNKNITSIDQALIHTYRNIISHFNNTVEPNDVGFEKNEIEIVDFNVGGISSDTFMAQHDNTTPEDLTSVEPVNYIDKPSRLGSLYKYKNVFRYICKCIYMTVSEEEATMVMKILLHDGTVINNILEDVKNENIEEELSNLQETVDDNEHLDTATFLISINVDSRRYWDNHDLEDMIFGKYPENYTPFSVTMARRIISSWDKVVFTRTHAERVSELKSLLIKQSKDT